MLWCLVEKVWRLAWKKRGGTQPWALFGKWAFKFSHKRCLMKQRARFLALEEQCASRLPLWPQSSSWKWHLSFRSLWGEAVIRGVMSVSYEVSNPLSEHSVVSWWALAFSVMSPVLWQHQLPLGHLFSAYVVHSQTCWWDWTGCLWGRREGIGTPERGIRKMAFSLRVKK